MDTELEDLQRRVEILENHLSTTEYGLGAVQMQLEMMTGWHQAERLAREAAGVADQDAESDAADPRFGRIESMMRSMLLHQADHAAAIRSVGRTVAALAARRTS